MTEESPLMLSYRRKAFKLCREYLQGAWICLEEKDLKLTKISGGLTNHIFRCSLPKHILPRGNEPNAVLLRLYGREISQGEDVKKFISSQVVDNVIFTILSERGLGPTLYGVFPEGRLEGFIPSRSMSPSEVRAPALSGIIARKMASIHSLSAPLNKETHWLQKMLTKYQKEIATISLTHVDADSHSLAKDLLEFDYLAEIKWLLQFLSKVNSPIVFCHNDVQGGNILLRDDDSCNDEDDKLMIIDYEFCGYNYRAFDLANHLSEWVYDYTNKNFPFYFCQRKNFPSEERMMEFCEAYLSARGLENGVRITPSSRKRRISTRDEVSNLFNEIQAFLLAPSLLWCMWGIVHSTSENIPFGYWNYATDRMTDYMNHKNRLLLSSTQKQSLVCERTSCEQKTPHMIKY